MSACAQCNTDFVVRPEDKIFYQKVEVPEPTLCPDCRAQRRYAFRNERVMYHRACDLTGREIISFHHSDKPFPVYDQKEWWKDGWDPMEYGRDFNFSRPFFEQFGELQRRVPRISMTSSHCENCDYAPYSVHSKSCYMCISCVQSEDLYYSYQTHRSKDCVDCSLNNNCELCYECLYCTQLFTSAYCQNCENGSGLYFCQDVRGCEDCIGCKNLVNKKYHIFNKPVGKEEYERAKQSLGNYLERQKLAEQAKQFFFTQPQRYNYLVNCENSTGDHLANCQNVFNSFESDEAQDCNYIYTTPGGAKDCQDVHYSPRAELVFDSMSAVNNYNTKFVLHSWDVKDSAYIDECFYSNDLFGCIGLKHKKHCVLNKQYSEDEYKTLKNRIMEQMRRTGEWGQFFPIALSTFAYNETLAQQYFPFEKAEVLRRGWQWREREDSVGKVAKTIPAAKLPDTIAKIPDDILNWAVTCEVTERPFCVVPQELRFYRAQNIPVPHLHPDERYRLRMRGQNPRQLFDRQCAKCSAAIRTTFAPERATTVYCDKCYLKAIY